VHDGNFFGFLEVDIKVPKHLYNYFSKLPPIVKNVECDEYICGKYTINLMKKTRQKTTQN